MDEKNIEVKVGNGHLTIKGEKQEEKEEKEKNYYLHERHFGSFERSFELPDGADAGKIEATFKKGVLTVTVPKNPKRRSRRKRSRSRLVECLSRTPVCVRKYANRNYRLYWRPRS